jgi:N-acetylglutamate synthase-like GNAT family acetyltransferase
MNAYIFRQEIVPSDIQAIEEIVRSSGFFSTAETDIACELAAERLDQGEKSSYRFLFLEEKGKVVGYTCYGLIPATAGSYDLYWIAVSPNFRGKGLGKILLLKTEELIAGVGGRQVYAETSSRAQYVPTQLFYEGCDYVPEAVLTDFYAPGDSKIIYSKLLK